MFNTIRIQLTLWFTGVLALVVITFAFSGYYFLKYTVYLHTDQTLKELSTSFVDAILSEKEDDSGGLLENDANINAINEAIEDIRFHNYRIFVLDSQGKLISVSSNPLNEVSPTDEQISDLAAGFSNLSNDSEFITLPANKTNFRIFAARNKIGNQDFNIFVSHPIDEERELLENFRYILLISVPITLILSSFGGYFLARKSLSPVVSMSDSASHISANNLDERLPVKNKKDELGNLATVFNSLLERLENSFSQQQRFMADASHELRTPLAIIRGESEVALSKQNRSNEELRESLEIVHDESRRLTKIVEDLFTLARADLKQYKINFKKLYLDEILADCVRKVRVLAEKRNISIDFCAQEMSFIGDEQLLHRLFINLLDNAIKYNRKGGAISITGKTSLDNLKIIISDTGTGILPDEHSKIFERFYRTDKSRTRQTDTETGGAGLGLSIASWIAEMHHAKIELTSSNENGSTFMVVFSNILAS